MQQSPSLTGFTPHTVPRGSVLLRGIRPKINSTAWPGCLWAVPESDTSAIQGVLSYEYTADEAFIVADLGRAGAIEEPTVACVAQAITHEYDSAAAAVRDVHGIAMWSNSAQEDSVLTALADLCGPQQFAGLYRNMGDGPQYMLFSEVVRPKLSVKAVPPKLSEEDVG